MAEGHVGGAQRGREGRQLPARKHRGTTKVGALWSSLLCSHSPLPLTHSTPPPPPHALHSLGPESGNTVVARGEQAKDVVASALVGA